MNRKKLASIILVVCLSMGFTAPVVYAQDDSGKIDLYEAFSSKEDKMKTEVGSRIYKWSMHLPDDGVIYKSDRANYFNMSTTSYQSSIQVEVEKNREELTIEELLYKMQNGENSIFSRYNYDKEFTVDIASDEAGQKYIRIIKANQMNDYFMVNQTAKEFSNYIESRIYIANNYIYRVVVNMKGDFYKQHQEMFEKLVSSFKLSYEEGNPYIKELSDTVSSTREFRNACYGWNLIMSPYWKTEGIPDSRVQSFKPVYSDEELNGEQSGEKDKEEEFKINEGIRVALVGSAEADDTAAKWAAKEVEDFKSNYNPEVYDIISNEANLQSGTNVQEVMIRYKTITNASYVQDNLYVVGNGYKYLVSAIMKEEKYNDAVKKSEFLNMVHSFTLERTGLSKYLGKIVDAETIMNLNDIKELKMKKFDFQTKLAKSWTISRDKREMDYMQNMFNGRYDSEKFSDGQSSAYTGSISNNEYFGALEPVSNLRVDMSAGLDGSEFKETVQTEVSKLLKDDEVRMGLAKVRLRSSEAEGTQLYYIEKEYDLKALKDFVKTDPSKTYDLQTLQNRYEYIVKVGKDIYIQNVSLPLANMTEKNRGKVNEIWKNTSICKKNYSEVSDGWKDHSLDEFNKVGTNDMKVIK